MPKFLPDYVCEVGQASHFRRIVDDFRDRPRTVTLNHPRRVHTGRRLELGLKAAFFSVLRGTIAAYKWLNVLMDTDLCTPLPRGLGENNFIKAAKRPRGAPPKHPLVTVGLRSARNGLCET